MTIPNRLAAAIADRYRLIRELGQGGMATVYLAEDLKHDRKVAVKVLKPELAAVLGAERFVVEIKTTAALQHPHILPLFDSGTADGFLFYVMPFIEGETLRDKLNRETQLGVDETVRITTEIADALHYAHQHGVIHRDIKPENILLANGRPMVADFGIALAVSAAAGGRMTETGLSLGTPHYMSPEQATAEKEITGRSDQYSLASVCYEMLTGNPPHVGSSAQQIIMKIITEQPQAVTIYRKSVPPHVAAAVAKALEKLPADRFASADAFAKALVDKGFATSTGATAYGIAAAGAGRGPSRAAFRAALVVAAVSIATAGAMAFRPKPERTVRRLVVTFPIAPLSAGTANFRRFLPTADGKHYVIVGTDGRLGVRPRDSEEFRSLPGTEGAYYPFESPDGEEIGFLAGGASSVKVVPLDGGPVRVVADSGIGSWGATWSADGYVYFSSGSTNSVGIIRAPATGGGPVEIVTRPQSGDSTQAHIFPVALPDAKGILFTLQSGTNPADAVIAVTVPGTGAVKRLLPGTTVRYLATGHLLVLTANGSLLAAPFNLNTLEITGPPVPVVQGVAQQGAFDGEGELHVTDDGTLWFQRGTLRSNVRPVWVTRSGIETEAIPDWQGLIGPMAISPDGSRVAYSITESDQTVRLWISRLDGSGAPRLFEREGTANFRPAWAPDGRTLAWISNRSGTNTIYTRAVDGQEIARRLLPASATLPTWEVSYPRRGPWVFYRSEVNASDIFAIQPGVDAEPRTLVSSNAIERQPRLSPDGRWLAYVSNEDGQQNVYVRPFPNVNDAVWQLTTGGAASPMWSRDGNELFYVATPTGAAQSGARDMVAVPIRPGESFAWGRPQRLFDATPYEVATNSALWDISPVDGRFLMQRNLSSGESADLVMVENFFVELLAKVKR